MPLYEYECTQCHERTEKIQKFSDPEITICPHCGGHLERVLSAPAISFKGGGWYADLYSSAKPAAAKSENKAASTSSDSSSATSSAAPAPPSSSHAPAASSSSSSSSTSSGSK